MESKRSPGKKLVSIVTGCFNEEDNVAPLFDAVKEIFAQLPQYDFEHIFIDNCSKDRTRAVLREMAAKDKRVKVILNTRNFGHIRSPCHGLMQAKGDAVISLVADFQDPPSMIADFLKKWEEGFKTVIGVKSQSEETPLMFAVRKLYYNIINSLSEIPLVKNYTGFGLYDKRVMDALRQVNDPYPYFRGLVFDIGFPVHQIIYKQKARLRGITKNNFYTLYDMAMLGITNHSKVPLRLATMLGFFGSGVCMLIAVAYLIAKLVLWEKFYLGTAPVLIGLFFFGSVQLFFIGILGEYIGSIHTQVLRRPLVIEEERLNFE